MGVQNDPDSGVNPGGAAGDGGLSGPTAAVFPEVYAALRALAEQRLRHEPRDMTLQPTALVHEVFLRLSANEDVRWDSPRHFYGAAAEAMRRILIERARRYATTKRGGGRARVAFEGAEDDGAPVDTPADPNALLALDEALAELRSFDAGLAEVVMLRFFAGMSFEEVAAAMERSLRAVKGDWSVARAWLIRRIGEDGE